MATTEIDQIKNAHFKVEPEKNEQLSEFMEYNEDPIKKGVVPDYGFGVTKYAVNYNLYKPSGFNKINNKWIGTFKPESVDELSDTARDDFQKQKNITMEQNFDWNWRKPLGTNKGPAKISVDHQKTQRDQLSRQNMITGHLKSTHRGWQDMKGPTGPLNIPASAPHMSNDVDKPVEVDKKLFVDIYDHSRFGKHGVINYDIPPMYEGEIPRPPLNVTMLKYGNSDIDNILKQKEVSASGSNRINAGYAAGKRGWKTRNYKSLLV